MHTQFFMTAQIIKLVKINRKVIETGPDKIEEFIKWES